MLRKRHLGIGHSWCEGPKADMCPTHLRNMSEDAGVRGEKEVHLGRKEGWKGTKAQKEQASPTGEMGALASFSTGQ